jgi:DNA anti-recombination protein RmuC
MHSDATWLPGASKKKEWAILLTDQFKGRPSGQGEERRNMSEIDDTPRTYSGALLAVLALSLLCALGGLIWTYTLSGRIAHEEAALADANAQNVKLAAELRETDARLKVTADELGKSLGLTQKQMDARAQQIIAREQAENRRLEEAQKQTAQQVTAVASDVSTVKTDVGGVKTDLGKTQNDLASAVSQLQSMKGDLSDHSSLIARNHDELEILKHKGDRSYYEFTLNKGDRKPVGTVSLELKKTDAKKSRFTLIVYADDKRYEKKDRNINEPLQFYSGKEPGLYEIVVNSINSKNQVAGYLSTPKNAPAPPTGQ